MFIATIVMMIIAVATIIVGFLRGDGIVMLGLKGAVKTTIEVLPLLLCAFIIAGMVQVLIPKEMISKWVGAESGWKGIFIGSIAGAMTPSGPFVSFPIVAALVKAGAGIGTTVSFIAGWSLLSLARIPLEVGMIGWRFAVIRILSTLIFPPIAGFLAIYLSKFIK